MSNSIKYIVFTLLAVMLLSIASIDERLNLVENKKFNQISMTFDSNSSNDRNVTQELLLLNVRTERLEEEINSIFERVEKMKREQIDIPVKI